MLEKTGIRCVPVFFWAYHIEVYFKHRVNRGKHRGKQRNVVLFVLSIVSFVVICFLYHKLHKVKNTSLHA